MDPMAEGEQEAKESRDPFRRRREGMGGCRDCARVLLGRSRGRNTDGTTLDGTQNIHSYKYSGLVNNKVISIAPTQNGGVSIKTRKGDADRTPPLFHHLQRSVLTECRLQATTSPRPRAPPRH